MPADLISLDFYLDSTGQAIADLDPSQTAQYETLIAVVSSAIRSYCDRDFTLADDTAPGVKTYRYRGHEMIEIDDARSVSQVAVASNNWTSGRILDQSEWFAMDVESPVLTYLEIYSIFQWTGGSPLMGFNQNLDQYPVRFYPTVVQVTADWGWDEIPMDVKQAAVISCNDFANNSSGQEAAYSSQSIASYSTTSSTRTALLMPESALPYKAQALLDKYAKWSV